MVEILLSTYNGEHYIQEQLDSILENDYSLINIIIRDDGSKDNTLNILDKYKTKFNNKITIIKDNKGNLGSTASFNELLKYVTADYFMFCDQDDIWCKNKISQSINAIKGLENKNTPLKPCLVFTDLYVTDSNLNIISNSFIRHNKLDTKVIKDISKSLSLSVAPGCTMIMNKACLKYIKNIPNFVTHDFWAIIMIVKYGIVEYLDKPTIMYRQHGNNVIGANLSGYKYMLYKIKKLNEWISAYYKLFKILPFKVSITKFIFWKIYYIIKRL